MRDQSMDPWFGPGSGWHKREAELGSAADVQARALAAVKCAMFRFAYRGVWLPPDQVLVNEPYEGFLTLEPAGDGTWTALMWEPDLQVVQQMMYRAELVTIMGVLRIYKGRDWTQGSDKTTDQTWLCAPTVKDGLAALREMIGQAKKG